MPDAQFAAEAGAAAHTFVDALDDDLVVDGDDGHHLGRSLRLRPGEAVTAADGSGSWRRYVVRANDRSRVELEADSVIIGEPRLDPALAVAFALTKGVKPDLVVQKLTELGADRVVVVRTQRSVPRWDESRAAAAIDRLARIAREAAVQSRRATVPTIDGVSELADLAAHPGLVVADPRGAHVSDLAMPGDGEWLVVVGPEGGLDPEELAGTPGQRLRLGPQVLRAETAAIAAAATVNTRRVVRA